ncbi:TIR domain-containing protein [Terribacillus saccharophilus]|uniref:TIR domain-containing protein n=1 Tax=Terribacillus saccharophilus TaxID=361277 RepID=UPI00381E540C
MDNIKPRVFIGSASESLDYVTAVQGYLQFIAEVTPWTSAFDFQKYAMDSLEEALETNDFAVFIFSPDDLVNMRNRQYLKTRDNSLFELGMFWGKLGRERVFFIIPDEESDYKLPSDLEGLYTLSYNKRSDNNFAAAVSHACGVITQKIRELGKRPNHELDADNYFRALRFYAYLCDKIWDEGNDKFQTLYSALMSGYEIPSHIQSLLSYRLEGASIWEANSEGIAQIAGNVGSGKYYDFSSEYNDEIMVIDTYLNNVVRYVILKDSPFTKTYLICYPIGKKFVLTFHISGKDLLEQSDLQAIRSYNSDIIGIVDSLLGGAEQ